MTFHDGTPFDAEAVCFNFDRWYNWTGIQQAETTSYYYGSLFRGFADSPENAVYESCEANGDNEVTINLAKPFAGFIAALSLPAFAMQSPTALEEFAADEIGGTAEAPSLSEYALGHPVGTGPFKFDSWDVERDSRSRSTTTTGVTRARSPTRSSGSSTTRRHAARRSRPETSTATTSWRPRTRSR